MIFERFCLALYTLTIVTGNQIEAANFVDKMKIFWHQDFINKHQNLVESTTVTTIPSTTGKNEDSTTTTLPSKPNQAYYRIHLPTDSEILDYYPPGKMNRIHGCIQI